MFNFFGSLNVSGNVKPDSINRYYIWIWIQIQWLLKKNLLSNKMNIFIWNSDVKIGRNRFNSSGVPPLWTNRSCSLPRVFYLLNISLVWSSIIAYLFLTIAPKNLFVCNFSYFYGFSWAIFPLLFCYYINWNWTNFIMINF